MGYKGWKYNHKGTVMTKIFKQLRKKTDENMSYVGKDVSQKLSYDNWLKKVKGIERGAHGIKGSEHTKFSKQWKDYRGKEKLAAAFVKEAYKDELTEGRMKELHTLIQQGKSAEEIAKIMKLDVKTIQSLMPKEEVNEVSPPGWGGSVKAMKKHADIDNPYALAWHMKNKGDKPHYKDKDGAPVKKDKYKDEQMTEDINILKEFIRSSGGAVKYDNAKQGWFDKAGKRVYLGKSDTNKLMSKDIQKKIKTGDWITPTDLSKEETNMKKEDHDCAKVHPDKPHQEWAKDNLKKAQYETHKYFDTKPGSIEDSINKVKELEEAEVTVNRVELDKLVKQYLAKGGTITKLPPGVKPGEDPDPKRKAYKVKKVGNTWKVLKASLREFIKLYNEHFLTTYAAEEFIAEEEK